MLKYSFMDQFNNTESFLLDISVPIINYLQGSTGSYLIDRFENDFIKACNNHRLFSSFYVSHAETHLDNLQKNLFEMTDNFLQAIMCISDESGCDGYNPSTEKYSKQLNTEFYLFCDQLLKIIFEVIDNNNFNQMLLNSKVSSEFEIDYRSTQQSLFERKSTILEAEKSILYWHDALPDIVIQKVIVHLRYSYIQHIIVSRKSF